MPMTVMFFEIGSGREDRRSANKGERLLSRAPKSTMMMFEQGGLESDLTKSGSVEPSRAVL